MSRTDYAALGGQPTAGKKRRKKRKKRAAVAQARGLDQLLADIQSQKSAASGDEWSELHNMESRVVRLQGRRRARPRPQKTGGKK